jgi:hypothetical protein
MRQEGRHMRFGRKVFGMTAALAICCGAVIGQRPAYQPASGTKPLAGGSFPATAVPAAAPAEIHVDQRCRILPKSATLPSGKKAKLWSDWNTCHLENVFDTGHRVQTVVGTEVQRSDVEIWEQQYVLGNQSQQAEVFIVEQPAARGWTIEGDPPPFRVADGTVYYRAWVQPGETVRLHVGMRKMTPLKPKALKLSGQAQQPAQFVPPPAAAFRTGAPHTP